MKREHRGPASVRICAFRCQRFKDASPVLHVNTPSSAASQLSAMLEVRPPQQANVSDIIFIFVSNPFISSSIEHMTWQMGTRAALDA